MDAIERLMKYASVYTGSCEDNEGETPSSPQQWELAHMLADEMRELGLVNVEVDWHAYVYGFLPATPGYEDCRPIGFIAHLDTVTEGGGTEIHPRFIFDYDGGPIVLGESGRVLDPEQFPDLKEAVGDTLLVTDGTSVLGADDKAGIAEILTLCEWLITDDLPHGPISICFTPDEEIGHGAALLDLEKFGASYAFTVDGGDPDDIEYETFNAASAVWDINGVSVHPGSAKDIMINAALVAMELNSLLPAGETPRDTEGREGFYHLCSMEGDVSHARLVYIVRDHNAELFELRHQRLLTIEDVLNTKYGPGTVQLTWREQYRNMAEVVEQHHDLLLNTYEAAIRIGLSPKSSPVRGGTDGAQLSFRGLPCPNLGTGAYGIHGPYEHAIAGKMNQVVHLLGSLVELYSHPGV